LQPAAVQPASDLVRPGSGFEVLVSVTMGGEDAATFTEFEAALAAVPEVRHAERLFGDPDCLLRITAADLPAYAALGDEALATLPGVQRLTSTIVMKRAVDDRPLPLSPDAAHPPSARPHRKR
jgi:DNA-binding Lrp family transcriptional regulator